MSEKVWSEPAAVSKDSSQTHQISRRDRILVVILVLISFVVVLRPAIAYLNSWRGDQYGMNGETKEAIAAYRKAVLLEPKDAEYRANLAYFYFADKKTSKAIEEYKKAVEFDPEETEYYFRLGLIYLKEKLYEEAVNNYQSAIKHDPKNQGAYRMLALAYERSGRIDEAIHVWNKMKKLFPKIKGSEERLDGLQRLKDETKRLESSWF